MEYEIMKEMIEEMSGPGRVHYTTTVVHDYHEFEVSTVDLGKPYPSNGRFETMVFARHDHPYNMEAVKSSNEEAAVNAHMLVVERLRRGAHPLTGVTE